MPFTSHSHQQTIHYRNESILLHCPASIPTLFADVTQTIPHLKRFSNINLQSAAAIVFQCARKLKTDQYSHQFHSQSPQSICPPAEGDRFPLGGVIHHGINSWSESKREKGGGGGCRRKPLMAPDLIGFELIFIFGL